MIALLPLLFRMAQCYRQAKQSPAKKFIGHIQMWNFGKYMTSVLTATLSFGTRFNEHILWYYIVSSIISTCYAYYWDLVNIQLFRNTTGDSLRKAPSTSSSGTTSVITMPAFTIWPSSSTCLCDSPGRSLFPLGSSIMSSRPLSPY